MKKYPAYKNSGIEWIGEIPEHWRRLMIRRITTDHKQGYYSSDGYDDDGYRLIRITDLNKRGEIDLSSSPFVNPTDSELSVFRVKKDDVLFPRTGSIGLLGIAQKDLKAVFASYLIRFRFNSTDSGFLKYFFVSNSFLIGLLSDLHGGVNQNIHAENIKDQYIALPPLQEQTTIANYLDRKTAEIDTLIAQKKRLISLYEEERTATINHAVTKGLNPNAPMKDSGIDWIGEIPEHWETTKVKFITKKVGDGLHGTPNYVEDSGCFFINGNNIKNGKVNLNESTKQVSAEEFTKNDRNLNDKTLLMSINGTIGNIAFYSGERIMLGKSVAYLNFTKNTNVKFISMQLESDSINIFIEKELSGSTIKNLSLFSINNIPLVYPSSQEQIAIVNYLDNKTEEIDQLISKAKREIALLDEYKTALISEVVLGKVDVREEETLSEAN